MCAFVVSIGFVSFSILDGAWPESGSGAAVGVVRGRAGTLPATMLCQHGRAASSGVRPQTATIRISSLAAKHTYSIRCWLICGLIELAHKAARPVTTPRPDAIPAPSYDCQGMRVPEKRTSPSRNSAESVDKTYVWRSTVRGEVRACFWCV